MELLPKKCFVILACATSATLCSLSSAAQTSNSLEEVVVTAQKRDENIQDVPISVATVSGDTLNVFLAGGEDILALAARVPGVYAESSNGRAAPRFYIRGLGNVDFDIAASQPVSIIFDDVVQENVVLKSFPLFDVEQVEVIRGPQGALFGRNTTAGIIKFNTKKPTEDLEGYARLTLGEYGTRNIEGAVGGALIENVLSTRVSALWQHREDWIDNGFTGENDALGGYEERAARAQFLLTPTEEFSALLNVHTRDLDGSSSIFRANVFDTGSNTLNNNYDRETVYFDDGDGNPQEYEQTGGSLKFDVDMGDFQLTSITAFEEAEGFSRGDIDGGVVLFDLDASVPSGITSAVVNIFGADALTFPGPITIPSTTQDAAELTQYTHEFRLASQDDQRFNWQVGAFFFDSDLDIATESFASFNFAGDQQDTVVNQENTAWAIFGQGSYAFTEAIELSMGLRYSDDEKKFNVKQYGQLWLDSNIPEIENVKREDDQLSWDISLHYAFQNDSAVYTRIADGFRAQSVQGRDVAFLLGPTIADSETILSYEIGYKGDLFDRRLRLNSALFYYQVDDLQLSAIGGAGNSNQLLNAEEGIGKGYELDLEWLAAENLVLSVGFSYNDTEIRDGNLATAPCGSTLCTVLDPLNDDGQALIDGNPFQSAPETTLNFTVRYEIPVARGGYFAFADYAYQGETNMALYESEEFRTDGQFELGLRLGYQHEAPAFSVALFGRNITDEDNVKGFIDFSNNTGFVNEPRVLGAEFSIDF